jgi:hypothetical protein
MKWLRKGSSLINENETLSEQQMTIFITTSGTTFIIIKLYIGTLSFHFSGDVVYYKKNLTSDWIY